MESESSVYRNDDHKGIAVIPALSNLTPGANRSVVIMGGCESTREEHITMQGTVSSGSGSSQQIQFSHELSANVALDSCVFLKMTISFRVTSTNAGRFIFMKDIGATRAKYALAQNPLHRAMKSLGVVLNSQDLTIAPHIWVNSLAKYHDSDQWRSTQNFSQPDPANNYYSLSDFDGPKSVFQSCEQDGTERSRQSCLPRITVIRAGGGDKQIVQFDYDLCEPLCHPYFTKQDNFYTTLSRIRTLAVNITFNDIRSMITDLDIKAVDALSANPVACKYGAPNVTPFVEGALDLGDLANDNTWLSITGQPRLLIRTYTPVVPIPTTFRMPYQDMIVRPYAVDGCKTAGSYGSATTSSVSYNQVPSKLYIFARPYDDVNNMRTPDAWLAIKSIKFSPDVGGVVLSNASQEQLFQMCCRNGLSKQSFSEFTNLQGSVVCIDLNRGDVGGYYPGVLQQFTYSLDVEFQNTTFGPTIAAIPADPNANPPIIAVPAVLGTGFSPNTLNSGVAFRGDSQLGCVTNWRMYVIAMFDGEIISDGVTLQRRNGIQQADQIDIQKNMFNTTYDPSRLGLDNAKGGSFFSSIGDWFTRTHNNHSGAISNIAKSVAKDMILPYARNMAEQARNSKDPRAMAIGTVAGPALDMLSQKLGSGGGRGSGMKLLG
jgi:hypothetical protein